MVLLNRRGYSPVVLCRACGKTLECKNCAIALTHHKARNAWSATIADSWRRCRRLARSAAASTCISSEPARRSWKNCCMECFPQARIARLDRDTVRGHEDFERTLNALERRRTRHAGGTQMIAKGHDIHGVTLVGVVGADMALGFPDFRAAERTFQLLTQVAGRAGRGADSGQSRAANLFSGPLRGAICGAARLFRFLRKRTAIPQLDALSAL